MNVAQNNRPSHCDPHNLTVLNCIRAVDQLLGGVAGGQFLQSYDISAQMECKGSDSWLLVVVLLGLLHSGAGLALPFPVVGMTSSTVT